MPNLFLFSIICPNFIMLYFAAVKWVYDLKIYYVINYMQLIGFIPRTPHKFMLLYYLI